MKKLISLLVVLAMLMTMAPAVFAAETDPVEVTIPDANEIGAAMESNTYTTEMYLVTGTITSIASTTWGNMTIEDDEGNSLYIYGLYDIDGTNRYDAMETKPVVGDIITVLGVLGNYNGNPQMKNGWLQEMTEGDYVEPDPVEITIPEAQEIALSKAHNAFTSEKYIVSGTIVSIASDVYGNMTIEDADGNSLYIYGSYNADGTVRYDAMDPQPVVGDTITIVGILGNYNGAQMKNGWITELIAGEGGEEPEVPEEPAEDSDYEVVTAPEAGVAYKFGMVQENVSATDVYFLNGAMNGYYMDTVLDAASAVDVYLEETDGGYYMYAMVDGAKKYINMVVSGTHVNGAFEDAASTVYTYDTESQTVVATVNDALYWFGTRNDKSYTTVGPCKTEYNGFYCRFYAEAQEGPAVESTLVLGNNEFAVDGANPEDARVYVAEQTGTLYITIRRFADSNVNYGAEMPASYAIITINGETYTSLNESVEVTKGDVVEISLVSVDGWDYYADIYLSFEGFYEEPLGSEMNPVILTTEDTQTPEIPANGELYFMLGDGFSYEHVLCVYGEDAYIAYTHWDGTEIYVYAEDGVATVAASNAYEFRIGNAGDTAVAFELEAMIPVGSESNPDTLVIGENVTEMSANLWAYCYEWTAEEDGTLTVTITGDSFWGFMLQNVDTAESYYLFEDGETNTASVTVNAGHKVIVQLTLSDPATYENIDGTLIATAEFTAGEGIDMGTEENPIGLEFQMNDDYTVGTTTVTVPAGETVYYYAYGIGGMVLTVTDAEGNVISSETLAGNPRMPVYFNLSNEGAADATYTLTVTVPSGTMNNPAELELGSQMVEVGPNGYFYTWTAEEETLFALTMMSENWTYSMMIAHADGTFTYGDIRYSNDETPVPVTVIKLAAGDIITLTLGTADWTEAAITFNASTYAGTESNPVVLNFNWNGMGTAASVTADLPAGEYVYALPIYGESAMNLFVNGEQTEYTVLDPMGWDPNVVTINNESDMNAVYTLELKGPAGTQANPDELELGYVESEMIYADYQLSHWYSFTAEEDTLLVLTMMSNDWYYWGMYIDAATGYPMAMLEGHGTDADTLVPVQVIKMAAGETIWLCFGTIEGAETVEFTAYTYAGTESNPVVLNFNWNGMGTAASVTADLPAGEYVYALPIYGESAMSLFVNGEQTEYTVLDPMGWDPNVVTINNETEMNAVYTLELKGPAGTQANPDELELGYVESEMIYADYQLSHWYSFTAEEDTLLVLTMMSNDWYYWGMFMDPATGYPMAMVEGHGTDADTLVPVQVIKMAAGETIWLCFGTIEGAETVEFTAYTYAGTESDPAVLNFNWNGMGTAASVTADLPAGEYVYALPIYGESAMNLFVNGEQTEYTVLDPMGWDPNVVTINNETEMNAVYTLELKGPAGTQANPDELELGYVESEMIYADYQLSHWYSFTAEEDTLLVLTMMSNDWYYWGMFMDAATGYPMAMVEGHGTDADTLVPVQVIKMAAGETIWLCFGTIEGAETVEFTAYTYAGTAEDPAILDFSWNEDGTIASLNADLPAGEYVYGQYRINGMSLTVNGEETAITAGGWFAPCTFTVNNTAETNAVVALELTYPAGHMMNPELIENNGEYTAEVPEASEGYYYNWIAPKDGVLTIEITTEGDWYFVVNNVTAGLYGDAHWSDSDPCVTTEILEVKAGDMIEIIVKTYNPEDAWYTPAGEVSFNLTFVATVIEHDCEAGEVVIENEVPATCTTPGSYDEVVYCTICGEELSRTTVTTELADHANLVHIEAVEPGCHMTGNIEHWYCTDCGLVWQDEALTQLTNHMNVILPATGGEVIHVEAKAPTCVENGNIEHWYCTECELVWQDEALTQITNHLNVILPATGEHTYVDGVCTGCGAKEEIAALMGDVNGDGKVDTTDAKLIMQYDLGIVDETALNLSVADANGDGKVDTTDAKLIMQLDLGIITEFPKKNEE